MKLAIVAGGWHWPQHFYETAAFTFPEADLFVVSHRNPELPVVRGEKEEVLAKSTGPLANLDRVLYRNYPTVKFLKRIGWKYTEAPNTFGDWGFFNQWLEENDYRKYDVILNCHDDTYLYGSHLLEAVNFFPLPWLILTNGTYPEAPEAYVRGSFEFWKMEMLEMLGGRIDVGHVTLTREDKTASPEGLAALSPWNEIGTPLRRFLVDRKLSDRVYSLSPYYRISPWVIEGERGLLSNVEGAPWSFQEGVKRFL